MERNGIAICRFFLALALGAGGAEALTYSWKPSTAAYAPVSGTPVTFSATYNGTALLALPFAFTYDSVAYTSMGANTDGLLAFGATFASSSNGNLFSSSFAPYSVLAPWWDELTDDATSVVQTATEGTAPNRSFVIQYGDYPDLWSGTYRLNWQVRLYEGSNRIQFTYGNKGPGTPSAGSSASVGIKGRNTLPGFYIEGTTGSRTVPNAALNSNTGFPAAGTVFTFAPDTAAPLGLTAKPGTGRADLTWMRTRLTSLVRYRIWAGTSPLNMTPMDSTAALIDTVKSLTGLANGTTYYIGVTALGPGAVESGFAQVVVVKPTTPPTVSITVPSAGSLVHSSAGVINLTANAADADGTVSLVEFYRGTTYLGSSSLGNPFSISAAALTGAWTLTARATDNLGAVTVSDPISFTVNLSPTASLTSPLSGAYALGTAFTMTASASDADGTVSKVEFLRDGVKIGEDLASPYSVPWTPDTAGPYVLTVRATDNAGGITISSPVNLTVSRPPTVRFTQPLNGAFIQYPQDSLTVAASDLDGTVSRVEYYNGATYLGSVSSGNPFKLLWNLPSRGTFFLIAKAYDNTGLAGKPDTIQVSADNVRLTSPTHFSAFATNASIPIAAIAKPIAGGSITRVDFYRDSVLIGSASGAGPTYGVTWANAPAGRYRLQARAVDNRDSISYSQAVTIFVNDSAKATLGGRLFVSGHDADDHGNSEFISAAFDYLLFGKAPGIQDLPIKKGAHVAFLGDNSRLPPSALAYATPTYINVSLPGWEALAFPAQPYDILMVGSGGDFLSTTGSAALNAQRAKFENYFNHGGGILALSEQGIGQSYYNFLPAFGSAVQQNIGSVSGVFTATPAGLAIGLTEAIVDRDLTHTEFLNVDTTVFRVFEYYNADLKPVSIGANAIIEGGGYVPKDSVVEDPRAISRDSVFADTLCIRFESPTAGAVIFLTKDGGKPDTSSWSLANGASVCIDNSTRFLVIAKKPGWVNSAVKEFRYRRSDQVAAPVPDIPPGYFRSQVCPHFTSATPDAVVLYTLDGGQPDTSSLSKANGDSICLDASGVIRVMGRKTGFRDSDTASYAYTRMLKAAMPTLDKPDSTWFRDSLCFKFSAATPGSNIQYTLDGGSPDTSEAHAHNGDSLCVDRSVTVRMVAKVTNFLPSDENAYRYFRMGTLARPSANPPDSTGFAGSLCVRFSTNTDGASFRYSLDGSDPSASSLTLAGTDSLCIDRTLTIRARAEKANWLPSPAGSFTYRLLPRVERPTASRGDMTWFADTVCVRFATATDSATLHYLLGTGKADTSSLLIAQGQNLCLDRSTVVRVAATRPDWFPSEELVLRFNKMDTVAKPVPDPGDSTYFPQSLCVRWTTATPGAVIRVTTDGSIPDSASRILANGDTLCLDRTATVRAVGAKTDWIPSPDTAATFLHMLRAARPTADKPDSTYFPDRICVRYSSATEGVRIHYALDGGQADTSSLSIANGDTLCLDRSARIAVSAVGKNWIPSEELGLQVIRMRTVAVPEAGVPDSTWFRDTLCVPWTTSTAGAAIAVKRTFLDADGKPAESQPDTAGQALASGDSVCLDRSAVLRAVGSLKNWINSPEAVRSYFRMDTVAKPVFDRRDTVFYPSTCVKVSSATPGADIRYTLDGGSPDTSRLIKRSGDTLCVDRSVSIRAVGERAHSVSSETASLSLEKMPQVAPLKSSIGDSAVFAHRVCFTLSSATDSVRIRYTLGGGDPMDDTLSMRSGDSLCLERSADLVAIGTRPLWRNSEPIRIALEVDNDGPRLVKAEKRPFDIQNLSVTGNCRGIGKDTLRVEFSEPLFPKSKPPRWDRLLVFSPTCDSGDILPVHPDGEPAISRDGREAIILLDNASADEKPKLGNCLSLDWRSAEFPDRVGNPPERHEVRIEGRESPIRISGIRAYPPVVGLDDAGTSGGCSDERVQVNTWIPPVGFDAGSGTLDPDAVRTCGEKGREAAGSRTAIPPCMSIVEVVSDGPYVADVRIFDQLGEFVQGSRQQFGACGELDDMDRSVAGKKRSYLVWNTRDRNGARVGNGVYVWRIAFQSEKNGVKGIQTVLVRTGFLRNGTCGD